MSERYGQNARRDHPNITDRALGDANDLCAIPGQKDCYTTVRKMRTSRLVRTTATTACRSRRDANEYRGTHAASSSSTSTATARGSTTRAAGTSTTNTDGPVAPPRAATATTPTARSFANPRVTVSLFSSRLAASSRVDTCSRNDPSGSGAEDHQLLQHEPRRSTQPPSQPHTRRTAIDEERGHRRPVATNWTRARPESAVRNPTAPPASSV